ncbi:hypothetical protein SAMN05661107_1201 [Maritimibacter sp. HL-12]|nr:hypothetical protein SAMN05661107_1201 [Maritimibacter sp. HL-12]
MIETRKAFNALVFYAPIEVIEACRGIIDKLIEYNRARDSSPDRNHNLLFNEALRLDQEAMSMARADVGFFKGEDQEAAAKFLYGKSYEPGDGI